MITAYHHIEINGVKYRLAEDAEGNHYRQNRQPLRLQTGAVVQGETGKFQLRQDLLEWRISDWSGGEGAIKFNSEEPNRYWEGHNIDPLHEIGKLRLARGWEETIDASTGSVLAKSLQLAKGIDQLWGASVTSNHLYPWDDTNKEWGVSQFNGEAGFGAGQWEAKAITGDFNKLYLKEDGVGAIWSYDGSSFVEFATDHPSVFAESMAQLSGFVYATDTGGNASVSEWDKAGTAPVTRTELLDLSSEGSDPGHNFLVAGSNRLYFLQANTDESTIWRITPSTAQGAGFGEEILRQRGLHIETLWFHMGVLFFAGRVGLFGNDRRQVVMYLRGSEVGVIANLRDGTPTDGFITATESQEFEKAYFLAQYGPGDGTAEWTLFALDLISGAVVGTTVIDVGDTSAQPRTLVSHNGEQFFGTSIGDTTNERTIRVLNDGTFVDTSAVTARLDTSVHDFGVVDEKILLSLRLSCEPLPTGSSIELQYQIDQDGTWVSAGTYSTAGGAGTTFTISTSANAAVFRNLQLRLVLSNGGTVANSPVVLSVSSRATVSAGLKLWDLLLDVSDDTGEASGERTLGTEKISNIETVGDSDTVVQLKDGYQDREVGEFETFDVVVDDYSIDLSRPQEGTALVRLRQVT